MGVIIQYKKFLMQNQLGLLKPIIFCGQFDEVDAQALSINKQLALELIKVQPNKRTLQMEKCFSGVISKMPNECTIKDFDVLFNPEYEIDVLKIMIDVCKTKPFSALWPGRLDGSRLIYAAEGYKDFKIYDLDDYDVTCVE